MSLFKIGLGGVLFSMKTISDLIKKEDLDRWEKGDVVLIDAPTGRGKSYFIMNGLYNYCKKNNKKILFLTNRDLLKDQFISELKVQRKMDIIHILNYQRLETAIINHEPNTLDMSKYDYVVADECHYFFTDALFNRNTDLIIEYLIEYYNSILILLSATCLLTRGYFKAKNRLKDENVYLIKEDYNYIDKFYFYKSEKVIQKLLLDLPEGEKALYITGAKEAYEMSRIIPNAKFICSKNNISYRRYSDKETYDCIRENQMYNCKVVCGTTVLDNGINIKDKAVKHIIIDVLDLMILKQCLGRKRINVSDDFINVYIKARNGRSLNGAIIQNNKALEQIACLENEGEDFFRKVMFKKEICKAIEVTRDGDNFYKVNKIMYYKLKWDNLILSKMLKGNTETDNCLGYKNAVCSEFKISIKETKILENQYDEAILENYVNKLVGIKMFKDEQLKFKEFLMTELFLTPKSNHKSVGLSTINSMFEERKINYKINSKREKSGVNRNKTYWIINEL